MTNDKSLKTITGGRVFPFMQYKWVFIGISLIVLAISCYEIFLHGLNFGVDFIGGTKALYEFKNETSAEDIKKSIANLDLGDVQVVRFGDLDSEKNQYMLRVKYFEGKNIVEILNQNFEKSFGKDSFTLKSQEGVGPKAGADMRKSGYFSIGLTCLLILIYIGFRFDFLFSPGAIFALAHDVIITVGFFAFFDKEFNLPILAAILTILGYSINDTIVVYDRIRENITRLPKSTSPVDVVNISLTETFRRTIVTSTTSLIVVLILFFMGGGVLHDFAFCLIIGIAFGTYSSVFIASPIYISLQKFFPSKGLKAEMEKVSA